MFKIKKLEWKEERPGDYFAITGVWFLETCWVRKSHYRFRVTTADGGIVHTDDTKYDTLASARLAAEVWHEAEVAKFLEPVPSAAKASPVADDDFLCNVLGFEVGLTGSFASVVKGPISIAQAHHGGWGLVYIALPARSLTEYQARQLVELFPDTPLVETGDATLDH